MSKSIVACLLILISLTELLNAHPIRLLIPLYSHPADEGGAIWRDAAFAAGKVPVTVIVGVIRDDHAPVGVPDRDYLRGLRLLRDAGVRLLAYVETSGAKRALGDVKEDVDAYCTYFDIDGIFYDEVSSKIDDIDYYEVLNAYARSHANVKEVILNASYIDRAYIARSSADSIIVFEGNAPDWPRFDAAVYRGLPAKRLSIIVNNVIGTSSMRKSIDSAVRRGVGSLYITDREFDHLPSYFQEEVDYIQMQNR